jgi:drug/metabolite transporter (DMT)-like permease
MNRAYVALLLAALSWGLALTTADAALAEISATDLLLLETAAGTLVVVLACWATGRRVRGAWRPAVVLGSLEPGIAYVFANVGLILTSAAVGSMLFALESVFVVALAAVLLRTRPRQVEITALVLGVLGTVLVASAQSGGRSSGMGVGIMVVSTLISAGYVLATKRFAGGNEPVALVARQGIASLMVTAPFILGASLNGGSRLDTASLGCILLACLTGVIGFSIPYTLWTTSLPHVRPGFAAVALNLVPLVGVISATLLGQGGLSAGQWSGGGLILVGLVLLTRAEMAATPSTELETTEAGEGETLPTPSPLATPTPALPVPPLPVPALPVPALPVPALPVHVLPVPALPRPARPLSIPRQRPQPSVRPVAGQPSVSPRAGQLAPPVAGQPGPPTAGPDPAGPTAPIPLLRPAQPAVPIVPTQRRPTRPTSQPTSERRAAIPAPRAAFPQSTAGRPEPRPAATGQTAPPQPPAGRPEPRPAATGQTAFPQPTAGKATAETAGTPLPERIRAIADAGMRRLREEQEAQQGREDGLRHRLRPGRAGQPVPTAGERAAARSNPAPEAAARIPAQHQRTRAHETLVDWLRGQQEVDEDVDVEALAMILTGALTHYQAITDGQDEDPFGIEEERYLTAIADLAAASLAR